MPSLVDKIAAKDYIADTLGPEWVIPTLWSGSRLPQELPWPAPYVVKANHGCGWNIFITDSATVDVATLQRRCQRWLGRTYGRWWGEWVYSQITPRLLVEPMLHVNGLPPLDYKVWVFHGHAVNIQVHDPASTRDRRATDFDPSWRRQPFAGMALKPHTDDPPRPVRLAAMIEAAEKLGRGFPFMRVDFYEVDGTPLVGELTFYPTSGFSPRVPLEYDDAFGRLWRLPDGRLPWPKAMRRLTPEQP